METVKITFAYVLATILGLFAAYFMNKASPNLNPVIKFFILPLLVIYIFLKIFQFLFPNLNRFGKNVKRYVQDRGSQEIYTSGYVEIFPPLFAVFILIIIFLYSGFI